MRKLIVSIVFLGIVNSIHSQNSSWENIEIKCENVNLSPVNENYLNKVKVGEIASRVISLQNTVAQFNPLESSLYKSKKCYITFKREKGKIVANFDRNGKLLNSYERFENVIFPKSVQKAIYKEYPGWYMLNNIYIIDYTHNKEVKKMYKVRIGNGLSKKNIKLDEVGNYL
ncbi:hypothetical protein [Aurantibacter sp.]|uniref:hypothetical protein n=1 Tax=Aurantibacter sp. TaxID=2807103 RepID=UPI003265E3F9